MIVDDDLGDDTAKLEDIIVDAGDDELDKNSGEDDELLLLEEDGDVDDGEIVLDWLDRDPPPPLGGHSPNPDGDDALEDTIV